MRRVLRCGVLLCLGVMFGSAFAQDLGDLDADQAARYRTLIHELRCLVCQNQTIADSNAPLAMDLREQVHRQILQGRSDTEIRRYLTDRYGDFVLYKPPFKGKTAVLWLGPFVLVAVALMVAVIYMRRSVKRRAAISADPEALRRLLDEESSTKRDS